jgi:hypothetical protein
MRRRATTGICSSPSRSVATGTPDIADADAAATS